MNQTLDLWTDGAMLALFDPKPFEGQEQKFPFPLSNDPRVRSGDFAVVGLQADGTFSLRVTSSEPDVREIALLNDSVGPLGLVVRSGRVYASGMDLPGEPMKTYARHGAGVFFNLAPGEYDVVVHEIDLASAAEAEQETLPNYVAVIRQRETPFAGVQAEPRFSGGKALERLLRNLRGEADTR